MDRSRNWRIVEVGIVLSMLVCIGCGTETNPVTGDLGTSDSHTSEIQQAADVLAEDDGNGSHETTPAPEEDALLPSWCESFCSGLEYGCPDGQGFSTQDCLGACVPSAVGECSQEWTSVEGCVAVDAEWSCGDVGYASQRMALVPKNWPSFAPALVHQILVYRRLAAPTKHASLTMLEKPIARLTLKSGARQSPWG